MPLISLIATLVVIGVFLWVASIHISSDIRIIKFLTIVMVIGAFLRLLYAFGF